MRLIIITINYNSSENTIKLLESLKNQTDKYFEIIVVDNNSDDVGKLMDYKTTETNIVYIKNDRNLGFSGGSNIGIRRALNPPAGGGADWVFLLNNDTWVENDFISRLKANLNAREGIIGLAIDEGDRIAYAGQVQWLKPTLIHIPTCDVGYPQVANIADLAPGTIRKIGDDIAIKTGTDYLILKSIQLEGRKAMDAKSFLNGHPDFLNSKLE